MENVGGSNYKYYFVKYLYSAELIQNEIEMYFLSVENGTIKLPVLERLLNSQRVSGLSQSFVSKKGGTITLSVTDGVKQKGGYYNYQNYEIDSLKSLSAIGKISLDEHDKLDNNDRQDLIVQKIVALIEQLEAKLEKKSKEDLSLLKTKKGEALMITYNEYFEGMFGNDYLKMKIFSPQTGIPLDSIIEYKEGDILISVIACVKLVNYKNDKKNKITSKKPVFV